MIARLRERLRHDDSGMTIVEVIIAMVIFALVSTGFVYTMLSVLSLTRDSRAREVAANLASEEIDLARDTEDLFSLVDADWSLEVGSDEFHVARRTSWVTDPNEEFSCGGAGVSGSSGGNLRYKRVNVTVTWDNMRASTDAVRSDTVINPAERVNDPSLGTIIVSVLNGAGKGSAGVSVTTSPSTGAAINKTDSQGCTYVLKVAPKTYTISLGATGYVDSKQQGNPSQTVQVVAGQTTTVGFQYDNAASFVAKLASNLPPGGTVRVPTNLETTFVNTYGKFAQQPAQGAASLSQTFRLHPFSAGYSAYAGVCAAADPAQWPEQVVGSQTFVGSRTPAVAALGGQSVDVPVPTGVVTVNGTGNGWLRAVSVAPAPGSDVPGCETAQTLTFGNVLSNGQTTVSLPYGTWQLLRSNSQNGTYTAIGAANIVPVLPADGRTTMSGNVITLDPRVPAEVAP